MKRQFTQGTAALFGLLISLLIMVTACSHLGADETQAVNRVSKEELKDRIEAGDPIVIDVRSTRDWENSAHKIPGAIRQAPASADLSWADVYSKDTPIHLYCA